MNAGSWNALQKFQCHCVSKGYDTCQPQCISITELVGLTLLQMCRKLAQHVLSASRHMIQLGLEIFSLLRTPPCSLRGERVSLLSEMRIGVRPRTILEFWGFLSVSLWCI